MEQQSDLSGGNWVVSATYLKGVGLVRRNNEFHHFDVLGTAGVITNASGAVLSTNVYDAFGVARYVSGNAQTQWRASAGYTEAEGLLANCYIVAELALGLALGCNEGRTGGNGYLNPRSLPSDGRNAFYLARPDWYCNNIYGHRNVDECYKCCLCIRKAMNCDGDLYGFCDSCCEKTRKTEKAIAKCKAAAKAGILP